MNVGYTKFEWNNNGIDNQVCPICGKHIYAHKRGRNFACVDINCPLGHGANELIDKIHVILSMME